MVSLTDVDRAVETARQSLQASSSTRANELRSSLNRLAHVYSTRHAAFLAALQAVDGQAIAALDAGKQFATSQGQQPPSFTTDDLKKALAACSSISALKDSFTVYEQMRSQLSNCCGRVDALLAQAQPLSAAGNVRNPGPFYSRPPPADAAVPYRASDVQNMESKSRTAPVSF